jgi:CheY-like chemotaxis protein
VSPRARQVLGSVLLADDDAGVRAAMVATLSRAGFEVTAVDDGAPAIALAEPLRFQVVLVDLHMKTSGIAVIRHYKQRYGAGVYCAVLSGEDDEQTRSTCAAAGADAVFCKPIPAPVLRRRLTEAVLALRGTASERSA